jgi:hypothetical protein
MVKPYLAGCCGDDGIIAASSGGKLTLETKEER